MITGIADIILLILQVLMADGGENESNPSHSPSSSNTSSPSTSHVGRISVESSAEAGVSSVANSRTTANVSLL
jgi:hypothetical protein